MIFKRYVDNEIEIKLYEQDNKYIIEVKRDGKIMFIEEYENRGSAIKRYQNLVRKRLKVI